MSMPWPLVAFLLLGFGLFHGTRAAHGENAPPAQIVGTVLCAACFNRGFSRSSNFISGASVLIECTELGFQKEVTTDERGKFEVHLPPPTSKDAKEVQGCTVKLIKSGNPGCDAVSSRASLRLKLNRQQPQELSVGILAFTPRDQPSSCARTPTWRAPLRSGSKKGSIHPESTRRAPKPSNYPAMAPVTSPPVLGSTTLPPSLPFPFPVPPSLQPLPFPFPPFSGSAPSPSPSQPPVPFLPPYLFPPTAGAAPPLPSIVFPFPPLTQPPIPSSPRPASRPPIQASAPSPPIPFPFPVPPSPPLLPTPPFPLPPIPASVPPLPFPFPFPVPPSPALLPTLPFPLPPIPASAPPALIPFPFPVPPSPALLPTLPFPFPLIQGSAPPPPTPSR